jgi:hypothetical protein
LIKSLFNQEVAFFVGTLHPALIGIARSKRALVNPIWQGTLVFLASYTQR